MRRSRWLLAWIVEPASFVPPVEAVACEGGNVLVNPGGEAGPDPWEYVNRGSRHQVGAVTFGTGASARPRAIPGSPANGRRPS